MGVTATNQCGQNPVIVTCTFCLPQTHEYHYLPAVSSLVKRLLRPGPVGKVEQQRREESLGKYLDTDLAAMFEEDCSGTLSSDDEVPLNFVEPTSLWEVLDSLVQVESLETHDS